MEDVPKPFIDHLEELRDRLIKVIITVGLCTVMTYQLVDRLLRYMSKPVGNFIFLEPTEAFFVRLKLALGAGVILALPVVIFQFWKFVVVALSPLEKRSLRWILPFSYVLFLMGFSFGFFVLVPAGVKYLLSFQSRVLEASLSIDTYIDFVGAMCLVLGGVFQMPLLTYFLAKV